MDQLVLTLVILLAAVLAESLGGRIGVAPSILMTVFGCLLALIPAVPSLNVPPELILPLVLPPLLYAAARRTSWRQFAENWQIIALRAVGLVIVTAVAVAAVFHAWNPATAVAAGLVLGALVAPPHPVAGPGDGPTESPAPAPEVAQRRGGRVKNPHPAQTIDGGQSGLTPHPHVQAERGGVQRSH
ncbi:cation:proton antiporter, partial [Nocardia neocaledoniensis]|uniref:cation:proton antiporter domain-containing protein n=1 Tax=Nocardia neocaledoniensis TaxID=236511 RepID=UPI002458B815